MPSRSLRTANYSEDARRRLGDAVSEARRSAGYRWRTDFCRAHPEVSKSSLAALEQARAGVGAAVLNEVGRLLGVHLPGWNQDTPRVILEGGPIPPLSGTLARIDSTVVGVPELPAIFQADDATLMGIIEDRNKIGTNEWLEVLGILLADDKITKEAYVHALTVGRKVRQVRKELDRKIADLQQSLTERVRAELSE